MYAGDNKDWLPIAKRSGDWPHDFHKETVDLMLQYGAQKKIFYCPGLTAGVNEQDIDVRWWEFNNERRIVGLAFYIKREKNEDRSANCRNWCMFFGKVTETNRPSEAVVVADELMSVAGTDFNNPKPSDFIVKSDNVPASAGGAYRPPHMSGNMPAGGNLLFLDWHAIWRPFRQMLHRYQAPSSSQPWYWY